MKTKRKPRAGHRRVELALPEELAERLEAVARVNYRRLTVEVLEAVKRHVKAEEARQAKEERP
jgi:predicted transcriptional regulator